MLLEVPSCFEVFITLRAVEKSFLCVDYLVSFEVASSFAGVFTLFTTKGLLTAMNHQVSLQDPNFHG